VTLVAAARKLYAALDPHAVIIGGICGAMYGVERFTRDVDLATDLSPELVITRLTAHGIPSNPRSGVAGESLKWVVSGVCDAVEFQVLAADDVGVRLDRAEMHAQLRIASVADFVTSKCMARGQQDLHDVAVLTLLDPALLPFARTQAQAQRCLGKLEAWLADERLRARYRR